MAGYLASRLLAAGQRRAAVTVVAVIGFGIVICEGWPSMGSDFGGVIALTPPVLWLVLVLSGIKITPLRLLAVGGAAVRRGGADLGAGLGPRTGPPQPPGQLRAADPGRRRPRRGRPQGGRVLGDDRAARGGSCAVLLGVAVWVVAIRFVVPQARDEFSTLGPVVHAVMATGVLGTVLNDAGVYVWLAATVALVSPLAWFWAARIETVRGSCADYAAGFFTISGHSVALPRA